MKPAGFVLVFCLLSIAVQAGGPYRNYLLSRIYAIKQPVVRNITTEVTTVLSSAAFIPRFERPKGAVFCRMEDKVTKATKVWLKIGVQ